MRILVDADACPVKDSIIKLAKANNISVIMFVDTCHEIKDGYSQVITVDKAADSVDIALINNIEKGDIVVTQDYGVAALALPKQAKVINQNGLIYTNNNIDKLLFERHVAREARKKTKRYTSIKKRTNENDINFRKALNSLIKEK